MTRIHNNAANLAVRKTDMLQKPCALCGTTEHKRVIDHIWPHSRAGEPGAPPHIDDVSNLQAVCARCNTVKGQLTLDECRERGLVFRHGVCSVSDCGSEAEGGDTTCAECAATGTRLQRKYRKIKGRPKNGNERNSKVYRPAYVLYWKRRGEKQPKHLSASTPGLLDRLVEAAAEDPQVVADVLALHAKAGLVPPCVGAMGKMLRGTA